MSANFVVRVDVHVHSSEDKLDRIINLLHTVIRKEDIMSKELDDLTVQVKANTDAEQSALVLINGFAARLDAAKADPVAIAALSTSLKSSAATLAAAVVANTPAA